MTDTSSSTEPGMEELQRETIRSIEKFSQIKWNFENLLKILSILQSLRMCSYAEELIVYFKNDNFNKDDLLEPLKTLLINIKTYKSEATSLKKQVERVGNSLGEILAGIGAIAVATADHFAGVQRLLLGSVGLDVWYFLEVHWERQTVEIEDIIKKLEYGEQLMTKLNAEVILSKAKKLRESSNKYSVTVRQALTRDVIQG
ncbi:unnamed protein product [Rhizophagus irregularis]|nr:unnamed protein product [Rhizophagus irregularis]